MQPKRQPPRLMLHSSTSRGRSWETDKQWGLGKSNQGVDSEDLWFKITGLRRAQTSDPLHLSLSTVKRMTEKGPR